jgi:hypothetical protein
LKDGTLTDAEKVRIQRAQNRVSNDIYRQKHDAQKGDPNSASSRRMQADVQRNINQQTRIEHGIKSGELTNREVGQPSLQARITTDRAGTAVTRRCSEC